VRWQWPSQLLLWGEFDSFREQQQAARLRAVAANSVAAEQIQREIYQRFSAGASQEAVVEFMRTTYPTHYVEAGPRFYSVLVGREPSSSWYCGSVWVSVTLRFENRKLLSTAMTRRADCI
jgi:hypothetical protein